jgi:hypothetical protein
MKRLAALLLLTLAAAGAQAHPHGRDGKLQCEVRSDYTMRMHGKAFVFTSEREAARHIALGGGRLFVNGEEVRLTPADRERVRQYEAELNRLVPQVQEVVAEATDIAFTALAEVARGFSSDGGQVTVARLEQARREVRADLARKPILINSDDIGERVIQPLVSEYVPVIAGNAVRDTLSVVFSADQRKARDYERRMSRMGSEIERKVDKRAEALEPKVESLCASTRELDRIEDGLALRLADGEPLDLLRTSR